MLFAVREVRIGKNSARGLECSLLRSRFLGCHATLPPKKRLLTTEEHSFPLCLWFGRGLLKRPIT